MIQPNLESRELLINMKDIPWEATSQEYNAFWEEEDRKINEGVTINGFYFSPFIYWHLNYWSIYVDTIVGNRQIRKLDRPQLWDTYLAVDDTIRQAETHVDGKKGVVMVGSRRISKELADYEPVITNRGEIPIGEIKIGDIAYGKDGKPTTVLDVCPQGVKPIYRLHLIDGRYVDCGLEHQWEVIRMSDKKSVVYQTQDLLRKKLKIKHKKSGYTYKYYLPEIKPVEYEEKELPIHPYILGYLLGDGSIRQGTPVFCTIDDEVEEYFKEILGPNYEITYDIAEERRLGYKCRRAIKYVGADKWSVDNEYSDTNGINPLRRKLDALGLNKNSHDKFIPELYQRGSVEQRFELLRGLMDSDGSISTQGSIEFCVNNEQLANDVAYLCRGLGIRCEVAREDKGMINKKWPDGHSSNIHAIKWRVYIRTDKPVFKLKRKLERIKHRKNTNAVAIDRIEYLCDYSATCIAVDNDDHIFLTKDYVPTHNSVLTSSYMAHKAITQKGSDNLISALNGPDLKVITEYVDLGLRNLPEYFKFPRIEDDWKKQVTLGYKDKQNVRHEWSKFHVRNFDEGNNTEAAAGLTLSSFLLEEGGKGKILNCLAATTPCFDSPYGWRCSPFVIGTSGDMTKAGDLEELFNNPDAYNFLPVEVTDTGKSYGLFIPGTKSLKVPKQETPLSLYLGQTESSELDLVKIWVSDEEKGKDLILKAREKTKKSSGLEAYLKEVMYYPLTHEECFLELSENIFPVDLLQEQLQKLTQNQVEPDYVELYMGTDGKVKHKFTDKKPVTAFPVKPSDSLEGVVQIWEYPITDAPYGLYTAGSDPYKQSQAVYSTSLGATYIYKRIHNLSGEGWQDIVVACYVGRPKKIEQWYEITKMLLKYYNAKSLCENMDYGFIQHCIEKNEAPKLLERTPKFLSDIHPNSTVNRDYGIHMTKDIKNYLLSLIIEYITEKIDVEYDEQGNIVKERLGVTRILDPLLLKELIKYTPKLNVDRIVSFGLTLAMAKSLSNHVTVSSTDQDHRMKEYFRASKGNSLFRSTRSPFRY